MPLLSSAKFQDCADFYLLVLALQTLSLISASFLLLANALKSMLMNAVKHPFFSLVVLALSLMSLYSANR
jgi:hypothetical protein